VFVRFVQTKVLCENEFDLFVFTSAILVFSFIFCRMNASFREVSRKRYCFADAYRWRIIRDTEISEIHFVTSGEGKELNS